MDSSIPKVFLVGSFNNWNTEKDEMILWKTDNQKNYFELNLELYSGLYYYKFYIPSQKRYIHDECNSNKVNDPYDGYNSVLEIPIQTHIKHPLLQTAQMKADVWWNGMTSSEQHQPYYKCSYNNLGILSKETSIKKV